MSDLVIKIILVGFPISLLLGVMGSIVVWKKMAFLGDSVAHSALLGGALSLLLNTSSVFVLLFICVLISALLIFIPSKNKLSNDSLLSIFSHGALSLGVISMAYLGQNTSVFMTVLFGDVLALTWEDVIIVTSLSILVLFLVYRSWYSVITIVVSEELARSEGISVNKVKLIFSFILGSTIGLLLKTMGSLLMTAMLVIPAVLARLYAKTPMQMIIYAIIVNLLSFYCGMYLSYVTDLPCAPTIVSTVLLLYVVTSIFKSSLVGCISFVACRKRK